MRNRAFVLIFFLLGLGGLMLYSRWPRDASSAPETVPEGVLRVEAVRAKRGTVEEVLSLSGSVSPFEDVLVVPRVSGVKVRRIFVEEGDLVERDQLLAELDSEMVEAQISQARAAISAAEAALAQARAQLQMAERDYGRARTLFQEEVIARQRLEQAETQLEVARSAFELAGRRREEARAALRQLEILKGYHAVRAPISGLVSRRMVDVGEVVGPTTPMFKLDRIDRVKVECFVPESRRERVRAGLRARVEADALPGRSFPAQVRLVAPAVDPATRNFRVELEVQNEEGLLRPGMFSRARLELGSKEVVLIPLSSVRRFEGTAVDYVFVVDGEGRARIRQVKLGEPRGEMVEVLEGISEGEMVIRAVSSSVRDGARVEVEEVDGR